jgi:hypothetical protein
VRRKLETNALNSGPMPVSNLAVPQLSQHSVSGYYEIDPQAANDPLPENIVEMRSGFKKAAESSVSPSRQESNPLAPQPTSFRRKTVELESPKVAA